MPNFDYRSPAAAPILERTRSISRSMAEANAILTQLVNDTNDADDELNDLINIIARQQMMWSILIKVTCDFCEVGVFAESFLFPPPE